jgi:hypothetical protein
VSVSDAERCFYLLRYAGANYCKLPWYQGKVFDPPVEAECEGCEDRTADGPLTEKDDGDDHA